MRRLQLLSLAWIVLWLGGVAHAEIPQFTPNVVDPHGYLSDDERDELNGFIAQVRTGADIAAAVYLTDRLPGDTLEEVANKTFAAWRLGEKGKDNGLLLVLVMEERKMRFETGYGLEGDLPDVVCLHALDDFLRPRLREGQIRQGAIDALYFLARKRNPSFTVAGRAIPEEPPPTFDARTGFYVWLAWAVFIGWLVFGRRKFIFDSRAITFGFFVINPGVFIFAGAALLSAKRAAVARALGEFFSAAHLASLGAIAWEWIAAHLILVPLYGLVAIAVRWPLRRYLELSSEKRFHLLSNHAPLRELDDKLRRLTGAARETGTASPALSIVGATFAVAALLAASIVFGIDYRSPPWFLLPGALFLIAMRLASSRLANLATPEAFRAYLERRIEHETARMERLVRIGHATKSDDGSYAYTAKYHASRSSSSSGSSSRSSSSGGGSSGGGGASSSW